jgi:hypothetical protein
MNKLFLGVFFCLLCVVCIVHITITIATGLYFKTILFIGLALVTGYESNKQFSLFVRDLNR